MLKCDVQGAWSQFLEYIKTKCSATAYGNWFAPIKVLSADQSGLVLEVPNIFVQENLLTNYRKDLSAFLPIDAAGNPLLKFVIATPTKKKSASNVNRPQVSLYEPVSDTIKLNSNYRFDTFIEGPANQFVKSAAMGVAARPGESYNPLFIYGCVGLGKTHILHSIGHYVRERSKKLRVRYTTTEAFINELVSHLREKSIKEMKNKYREEVDILLVDDIQFLQDRPNFQEEFACMFEALSLRGKQVVITSDKLPSSLKLSERTIGKMEGGLVVNMGAPDLETRVAILQSKAEIKGFTIPHKVAFYIAENIQANIRQLEGAVNKLCAYCKLLNAPITIELADKTLKEMFNLIPKDNVSIDEILKHVSAIFKVRTKDIKETGRQKEVAMARQVAMYLCKELVNESITLIGLAFGKTHSTVLHAHKKISEQLQTDELLKRQVSMVRRLLVD